MAGAGRRLAVLAVLERVTEVSSLASTQRFGAAKAQATDEAQLDPDFFEDFARGESTFSEDGISIYHGAWAPGREGIPPVERGFDPADKFREVGSGKRAQVFPEWFEESASAGYLDAWQTNPASPALHEGASGDTHNHWRRTSEGWVQDYRPVGESFLGLPQPHLFGGRPADWFDTSVDQFDGFGRNMLPTKDNGAGYPFHEERSVNTTLTCAEAGCNTSALLQAYDASVENGTHCRLSVFVQPTDYDGDFPGEEVEYIKVNGRLLSKGCKPAASGCSGGNASYAACVNGFPVDSLISEGALVLEMKNSALVDECPFEGNLLHAVAMVTCLLPNATAMALMFGSGAESAMNASNGSLGSLGNTSANASGNSSNGGLLNGTNISAAEAVEQLLNGANAASAAAVNATAVMASGILAGDNTSNISQEEGMAYGLTIGTTVELRCQQANCTADDHVYVDPTYALNGGKCLLNINISQTDFDGGNGVTEVVEFFRVAGTEIGTNVAPGLNPCMMQLMGKPVAPEDWIYPLVQDYDVTELLAQPPSPSAPGNLQLQAKISASVDECGAPQGTGPDLLHAVVRIECAPA